MLALLDFLRGLGGWQKWVSAISLPVLWWLGYWMLYGAFVEGNERSISFVMATVSVALASWARRWLLGEGDM